MLEQAVQGGDEVIIAGDIQEVFRCCTEVHGLTENIGVRWTLVFSYLGDSMIFPSYYPLIYWDNTRNEW